MVRTAESNVRVSGGKSTRKGMTSNSSSHISGDRGTGVGNSVCPRQTPNWQKPITNFFAKGEKLTPEKSSTVETSCSDQCDSLAVTEENSKTLVTNQTSNECTNIRDEPSPSQSNEVMKVQNKENGNPNQVCQVGNKSDLQTCKRTCSVLQESEKSSDENIPVPKKFKLDKSVYKHLEALESLQRLPYPFHRKKKK